MQKQTRLPVAGMRVGVGSQGSAPGESTITDSQGRFSFSSLYLRKFVVRAEDPGGLRFRFEHVELSPDVRYAYVELVLPTAHTIRGTVVADDGRSLEGVKVQACYSGMVSPDMAGEVTALTDASGRFVFSGLLSTSNPPMGFRIPGYRLLFHHDGYSAKPYRVEIIEGQDPEPLVAVMQRLPDPTIIVGQVVTPAGEPRPDVEVRWGRVKTKGTQWGQSRRDATTDEQGKFTFSIRRSLEEVDHEEYFLDVVDPEFAPMRLPGLAMAPGATEDVGIIKLKPGQSVWGRIVDETGQPVFGATLTWKIFQNDLAEFERHLETGEGGRFALVLPDGVSAKLWASPPSDWMYCMGNKDQSTIYVTVAAPAKGVDVGLRGCHPDHPPCKACENPFN